MTANFRERRIRFFVFGEIEFAQADRADAVRSEREGFAVERNRLARRPGVRQTKIQRSRLDPRGGEVDLRVDCQRCLGEIGEDADRPAADSGPAGGFFFRFFVRL